MTYNQITLNGLDLINDNYFCTISGAFDMEKTIISNDLSIDGQSFARSKINPKNLVLNVAILRLNETNVLNVNKAIYGNDLKTIVLDTVEIGKVHGTAEVKSKVRGDSINLLSISLTMFDPYWYSEDYQRIHLGATYSSGLVFSPSTHIKLWGNDGIKFGAATGEAGTIVNSGNTNTYPQITVMGACSGITVINVTTNQSFSYAGNILSGDALTADFSPEQAIALYVGSRLEQIPITGDLMKCVPGNNVFTFARNSTENIQHCEISIQSRWI